MVQHHKYSLTEVENMMPFELDLFVGMLKNFLKEEEQRMEREAQALKMG
jgi:hypothetical protein